MSLDFLLEMGWKSAGIAGIALALLFLLRSRSAADRAAVLRLSVLLLLALPILSLGLPRLEIESWVQTEAAPPAARLAAAPAPIAAEAPPFAMIEEPVAYEPEAASISLGLSLFLLYAAGLLLVLARLVAGLWTLRRWTAAGSAPVSPAWTAAFRRAVAGSPLKREVRLLVSDEVPSPMSWGRGRPVILIDPASHARGEDAEAILAHELAHVRRGDWPALMLSRLAVALFWFNPLVWLIERALIQQAEEAADLQAVNGLEPALYARSLIACIRCSGLQAVPANGMARADGLSRRVHAVLDARLRGLPSGGVLTLAVMLVAVLVSAPLSALKLVPARAEAAEPGALPLPDARPAALAEFAAVETAAETAVEAAAEAAVERAETAVEAAADAREAVVEAAADAREAAAEAAVAAPEPEAAAAAAFYAAAPAAPPAPTVVAAVQPPRVPAPPRPAAPRRLDVDTLVALRIHGVDAAYIEAMQAAFGARFTADQLVAMRIHGLTPARIREFRSLGYRVSHDAMMAMSIHGVSGAYIRALAEAGYPQLSADQLVEMKIHGVSIDDARKAKRLGLSARELVRRTILGVL